MKNFLLNLLDWIYKKKCYFCSNSAEGSKMCSKCYNEIDTLPVCKDREILCTDIYSCGVYDRLLQKMIRGLKYHNQRDLAYFQAKFMYEYWKKIPDKKDSYQVVPVPLFKQREKKRRYNHMTLVAQEFCKLSGYELKLDMIERIKDTKPQYNLNKAQRMDNLAKAFKVINPVVSAKPILLIDDICTTGATFENIITELKKHGINNIVCFTTAKPSDTGVNV